MSQAHPSLISLPLLQSNVLGSDAIIYFTAYNYSLYYVENLTCTELVD